MLSARWGAVGARAWGRSLVGLSGRTLSSEAKRPGSILAKVREHSLKNPEEFWGAAAKEIDWYKPYDKVIDRSTQPTPRWFVGGVTNTCYNALDRHVERGRADQTALIWDSPVTDKKAQFTYRELLDKVATFAGALKRQGISKGDRVLIYMPMVPEAAVAMLACARLGAIHSVVFGGFAPSELASRINDAKPKLILTATCGYEGKKIISYMPLVSKGIELSNPEARPSTCVVLERNEKAAEWNKVSGRDIEWTDFQKGASAAPCTPVAATDPAYLLYTSGSTGSPKGVIRDTGGHMVAVKWALDKVYDIRPGETWWAASDIGWVVGHSFIIYGPLLHGCTTIMFEGKPVGCPDAGTFWRIIADYKVNGFFTAPTAFRAIKGEDPEGKLLKKHAPRMDKFRVLYLAGERSDPTTLAWAEDKLKVPVIDNWWQTETGWPMVGNPMGIEHIPVKHGSATHALPGWDVRCLSDAEETLGQELPPGQVGELAVRLPLPPGALPSLWNDDARFVKSYLTKFGSEWYQTGDAGYIDAEGYIYVMARADDVICPAGHRFSTGQMEQILSQHKDVAKCAVIGVKDALKGQVPVGFVVLNAGVTRPHAVVIKECVELIREAIGAVACFRQAAVVPRLPETRSGKYLRSTMRKIADGESYTMPSTIVDPVALQDIASACKGMGLGVKVDV